jgi:hypothetical protein
VPAPTTPRLPWIFHPRWSYWRMYALLAFMALADAYGFWTTLDVQYGKDKAFLLVVVIALALGAVAGAHWVGRLKREWREAGDASLLWIAFLATVWLLVGAGIAWTRARQNSSSASAGTGTLQLDEPTGYDQQSLTFALLLLGLYLLTGALAATHAYQHGDSRSVELREAVARQQRLAREHVQLIYEMRRAEGLLQHKIDEQERDNAEHEEKTEEVKAYGMELRAQTDEDEARNYRDPAATDATINRPRAQPPSASGRPS